MSKGQCWVVKRSESEYKIQSTTSVNLATRVDYLATFICIHTGVCRRKEDFKGDSFSPYADKSE